MMIYESIALNKKELYTLHYSIPERSDGGKEPRAKESA